ncbi:hypothetical protein ACJRO7_011350 [Eucalyptus globulus]|uniref:Uncharacterized protein n=1 Tax=Eucalyptus globulus TaxID=34317 RepID=A0ABD3LI95_EUCGL
MQMICLIICLFVVNALAQSDLEPLLELKKGMQRDRSGQLLDSYDSKSLASDGCPQNSHGVTCSKGHLDLHGNGFAGDVTKLLSVFCSVEYADLSYNQLSISLDLVLGNSSFLSSIRYLNFSSNSLAGDLEVFDASTNRLVGKIPPFNFVVSLDSPAREQPVVGFFAASAVAGELYDLHCATILEHALWQFFMNIELGKLCGRSSNSLTGTLPIQTSQFLRLASFQISDNLVWGPLPQVLGTYPELKVIGLSLNQLSGTLFPYNSLSGSLPWEIDRYCDLVYLDLSPIYFEGGLPDNLLDELQGFNVSYNNFSGTVPENLRRFPDSALHPGNSYELGKRMRTATKIALIADLVGGAYMIALLCFLISCSRKQIKGEDLKENIWKNGHSLGNSAANLASFFQKILEPQSNSSVAKVNVDLSYVERVDELVSSPISLFSSSNPLPLTNPVCSRLVLWTSWMVTCIYLTGPLSSQQENFCLHLHSGHVLVVKWLRKGIAKGRKGFTREVKKLGSIKLPNLVPRTVAVASCFQMLQNQICIAKHMSYKSLTTYPTSTNFF